MVVVRPPEGSCILPPGLCEDSFDVDTRLGRASLLSLLFSVAGIVNREKSRIADLILILSGPVTYWFRPGGGIPWDEIGVIRIHPLNFRNVGFRYGWGSLELTGPLMEALAGELERSGFTVAAAGPSSVTVAELGGTRIALYNPVEIGYSSPLWQVFDPATCLYVGPPEKIPAIRKLVASLPDKRTQLAAQFINAARAAAGAGDETGACRSLAGAAQVLGKIRLRGEIVTACTGKQPEPGVSGRFLADVEEARARIDALWRYHAGEGKIPPAVPGAGPLEPVRITVGEEEAGAFTSLCRDLGIVCIAARTHDAVTIVLDRHDLEQRAGVLGGAQVPAFAACFEEVPDPSPADRGRLIALRDAGGRVRYYGLKGE